MPDELTVLFTPKDLPPFVLRDGNATLIKSSARREKHDAWGANFTIKNKDNEELFTAETIHLVARIEKVQIESVQITIT